MRFSALIAILAGIVSSPAYARSSTNNSTGLAIFGIFAGFAVFFMLRSYVNSQIEHGIAKRKKEIEAESARQIAMARQAAEEERKKTLAFAEDSMRQIEKSRKDIEEARLAFESSYIRGRKWLAEYIAETLAAPEEAIARSLEHKKHPATKAADEVRRVSAEKKELRAKLKYLEYAVKTYHEYYPVLEEYSDDILNELATLDLDDNDAPDADRVASYISKEEYAKLSVTERNQLALDKWRARHKSNVEIGRMFERYLGYLYEKDGWTVTFIGALEGLEDMGRDLLCVRDDSVHVVQAKYWSKYKTIHEKHIFQLYGTTILVPLTHPSLKDKKIVPIFATTTQLSDTARWAADTLGVKIRQAEMDHDYPAIKCNINGNSRIYHLPFDQQYDRVRIIPEKGEMYVQSVVEAEAYNFRRAKRHIGT